MSAYYAIHQTDNTFQNLLDTYKPAALAIPNQDSTTLINIDNTQLKFQKIHERMMFEIGFILLAGFILTLTISILFINSVLRPIQSLTQCAKKYGEGEFHQRIPHPGKDELGILESTFNQMAEQLDQSHQQIREMSIRDYLTGLFNRREFMRLLTLEMDRSVRHQHLFALIIFDLDHFKEINDRFGHPAGDKVLTTISKIIGSELRPHDVICRYGGEEFSILLPITSCNEAMNTAERLRKNIQHSKIPLHNNETFSFTASFGVACYPNNGEQIEDIIQAADKALYHAKHKGRNSVVLAENDQNMELF
ncbi:MAG: diguanylate cyclase [Gammaproteobacteria bacterium]|nr:diguanylate cyclase [Gammaproteobacteria bacterium]